MLTLTQILTGPLSFNGPLRLNDALSNRAQCRITENMTFADGKNKIMESRVVSGVYEDAYTAYCCISDDRSRRSASTDNVFTRTFSLSISNNKGIKQLRTKHSRLYTAVSRPGTQHTTNSFSFKVTFLLHRLRMCSREYIVDKRWMLRLQTTD
ncbi:hypothetical protein DPMN_175256 [Dreissena polymorpha]|uniref:Uncharacterized protein n=1 Tax=Dreissena polymorpha TaxID=45954 RepID=A0A9D4IH38_DREPO|nr:hypothetical protein DPMN_175256 [Dreissena polymorpha]